MNRIGYSLLLLLLAQLVVLAALYRSQGEFGGPDSAFTVADTGPYLLDEIRIADGDGSKLTLLRTEAGWSLAEPGGLPADTALVENLLEQLTATDPGWPVAHTLAARQRFQVAPYHYRRRIELWAQSEKISSVFLGTSPGFRKVHARNAAEDEIFSIGLNLYETTTRRDQWLDRKLLQVRAPLRISSDSYRLDRSGGEWRDASGEPPDARELEALVTALGSLQVKGLADETARDELAFAEAALILQIESLAGSSSLQFYRLGDKHYVISSEYERPFVLSSYSFDQVTGIDARLLSSAQ